MRNVVLDLCAVAVIAVALIRFGGLDDFAMTLAGESGLSFTSAHVFARVIVAIELCVGSLLFCVRKSRAVVVSAGLLFGAYLVSAIVGAPWLPGLSSLSVLNPVDTIVSAFIVGSLLLMVVVSLRATHSANTGATMSRRRRIRAGLVVAALIGAFAHRMTGLGVSSGLPRYENVNQWQVDRFVTRLRDGSARLVLSDRSHFQLVAPGVEHTVVVAVSPLDCLACLDVVRRIGRMTEGDSTSRSLLIVRQRDYERMTSELGRTGLDGTTARVARIVPVDTTASADMAIPTPTAIVLDRYARLILARHVPSSAALWPSVLSDILDTLTADDPHP